MNTIELSPYATNAMMLYGTNINLQRAIPSIVDGLKPVHRRIIYALLRNHRDNPVTVATLVGETLKWHPHGEIGMKDIVALIAQPFSNNIPLLKAIGNCGTYPSGKDAAASRYWKVQLPKFVQDVLLDEFDGKVNMKPNHDDSDVEPITFPAKFPIVLLNGSNGIGYTLSSDCLPYNLNEIADATIKLLKNPKAKVTLIPDSPTGCDIIVVSDTVFTMQAAYEIDTVNYTITFKNTPFGEYLNDIDDALCAIQQSTNPIKEILSADDESVKEDLAQNKIKYVVRCKPGNMYKVLNTIFKRVAGLRITVNTRNCNVVDSSFKVMPLQPQQIILRWIANRLIEKRAYYLRELVRWTTELNMLDGKMYMLSPMNLEKTVSIFRKSKNRDEIIQNLVDAYKGHVTTSQANYIADVKLIHLTTDEFLKTEARIKDVKDKIEWIRSVVDDPEKIKNVIADDIREIKKNYGFPRRSKILNLSSSDVTNVSVVQIMTDGSVMFSDTVNPDKLASDVSQITGEDVCLIDEYGQFVWININDIENNKPYTLTSIGKTQMGKCISAISNKDHSIIILTNKGRIKYMPVNKIPTNQTKKPIIPLNSDERIVSVLDVASVNSDLLVYTSDGLGKRFSISDLNLVQSVDAQGQFIINGHEVAGIFSINPNKPWLVYVTKLARIRVNHTKFLGTSKKFGDVKSIIKLSPQDDLVAVFCADKDQAVTLYHVDGRITTVDVGNIEPGTMSMPPVKPKHVPAVKVLRAILS
jgi:DNA gyrase/topoisomerase IV subunit A